LSKKKKHEYIAAVKCLQEKPAHLAHLYPGSKSRFDDFQASHIDLTPLIHWNVSYEIIAPIARPFKLTAALGALPPV
jgi:tyrosinase